MAATTSNVTVRKLGPNDLCHCGSGKKYKRCHRDIDIEAARSADARTEEDVHEEHPQALCSTYRPISRKRPANERPDYLLLLKRMRTEGRTLLHVDEPSDLGRDQAQLDAAAAAAARLDISLDFRYDPFPHVLAVGQKILDHLLGSGVYKVRPSGLAYKKYGKTLIRPADGQVSEVLWSWRQPFGKVLILAKSDEWSRRGMGVQPLSLAGAGAELLRDLLEQHQAISALIPAHGKQSAFARFEVARLVTGILAHYADDPEEAGVFALAGHVAVGLALGPAVQNSTEWDALAMGMDEATQHQLDLVRLESLADAAAMQAILAAPSDWNGAAGFSRWVRALRDFGATDLLVDPTIEGIAADQGLTPVTVRSRPPLQSHGSPLISEDRSTLATVQTPTERERSLFQSVEDVQAPVIGRQDELARTRQELIANIATKVEQRRELESQLGQVRDEEERLAKLSAGLAEQIQQQEGLRATLRARALLDVLERGSRELAVAEKRWNVIRADVSRAKDLLESNDQLKEDAQLLSEYNQLVEAGQLDQMPPTLRGRIEADAEAARQRLGPIFPLVKTATPKRVAAVVPIVVALGCDGTVVRLALALPFPGVSSQSLLPESLELAILGAVSSASQDVLDVLETDSSDAAINHYSTENCSIVWIEASSRLGQASIDAAGDLYRVGVQDALLRADPLIRAEVGCEVSLCSELDFEDLQEVMKLARP